MMGLLLILLILACGAAILRAHYIVKSLGLSSVTEDVVVF